MLKRMVGKLQAWHRQRRLEKENYIVTKATLMGMEIHAIQAYNEYEAYLACDIGFDVNEIMYHTDRYVLAEAYLRRRESKARWYHLFRD